MRYISIPLGEGIIQCSISSKFLWRNACKQHWTELECFAGTLCFCKLQELWQLSRRQCTSRQVNDRERGFIYIWIAYRIFMHFFSYTIVIRFLYKWCHAECCWLRNVRQHIEIQNQSRSLSIKIQTFPVKPGCHMGFVRETGIYGQKPRPHIAKTIVLLILFWLTRDA